MKDIKLLKKYVKAKFKLLKNQLKGHFAFVKRNDLLIHKELRTNKFKSKIIKVDTNKIDKLLDKIKNTYFLTETNRENLSFVLEISKKFKFEK